MAKRQQICFHGVPAARAQTSLACSALSQRSQPSVSSIRLIAAGDGGGSRIGSGSLADAVGELLLYTVLSQTGRWQPGRPVQLRTPPIAQDNRHDRDPAGVAVRIFPIWFTCEGVNIDKLPMAA